MGDVTSLAPHERLLELPVVAREKPHTGAPAREKARDPPVIERLGPSFPAYSGEPSRVFSPNSTGGLNPYRLLRGLQEIAVVTREQSTGLCLHSR